MSLETSAEKPAPLRDVSARIGDWISRLGTVWIEAEVAQLNRRSGICFLTLRDLTASISISAKCHVTVLDASPSPVTEGTRIVAEVKPDFYPPNGSLALDIRQIRPAGEGELLAQLERRKRALQAEGLFDPRHKLPLPVLPRGIGLITGKDSAAERDVIENVRLRWPAARIVTIHALMQGAQSARQVIDAVAAHGADESIDVIVIARGGGSMEDLLPFSDEALVRAVFACRTPVVSAIGHEPDTPILDNVADLRASTPTDAAKRIVPDVAAELDGLTGMRRRGHHAIAQLLQRESEKLAQLRSRPVLARPTTVVDEQAAQIDELLHRTRRRFDHQLIRATDDIGHQLARIRGLSPLATLQRGYAVVETPDGHVVASVTDVPEHFGVRLADGHVDAQRTSVRRTAARPEEQP